jgi:prepilin-type N-terminal cleavage/methylation domain-containing protein
MSRRQQGFNVVEIMIAVLILSVLLGIGAPYLRDFLWNARITARTNDIMSDLAIARSEAVKNQRPSYLCPSALMNDHCDGADWRGRRTVIVDLNNDGTCNGPPNDITVKYSDPPITDAIGTITLAGGDATYGVVFRPTGAVQAGATPIFRICDTRNGPNGVGASPFLHRQITVAPSGRANITYINCQ